MRATSEASHELHLAAQKLASLTRLVKRRGLLADPSQEIERLTASVKGDMASLTTRLDVLQQYVAAKRLEAQAAGATAGGKTLATQPQHGRTGSAGGGASVSGGAGASGGEGGAGSAADAVLSSVQGISHGDAVLASLKGHLVTFGRSLKGVLQARAESLKSQAGRRQALGASRDLGKPLHVRAASGVAAGGTAGPAESPHTSVAIGGGSGAASSSAAAAAQAEAAALFKAGGAGSSGTAADARARRLGLTGASAAAGSSGFGASGLGGGFGQSSAASASAAAPHFGVGAGAGSGGAPLGAAAAHDPFAFVSQAQLQPDAEAAYLDARAADVQALERHIADLGGMFARLATLVSEQGESVQRIEDAVSGTLVNIDASAGVLQRAWERARDNGALAVRVSAILIFFVLLFVLFGT